MNSYCIIDGDLILQNDWKEFVKAPEAPSNYKRQETIDQYIQTRMENLESDVIDSCPSLLTVSNLRIAYEKTSCIWQKDNPLDQLSTVSELVKESNDRLIIIGKKNILCAIVGHPRFDDPIELRDFREAVWTHRITCHEIEDIRFCAGERKMLLVNKFMSQNPDESYMDYSMRMLNEWGLVPIEEWVVTG